MADRNRSKTSDADPTNVPTEADLGVDVGYLGTKVDPRPNEAYSLESGPDSPSAADVAADVAAQRTEALEASQA